MHINLSGKTAIVSASTGGIGFAIACGLARAGAHTIINGRSEASLNTRWPLCEPTCPAPALRAW
jgi:NAD(P)-dependent dehydrogenase (short-subunit alcohol dehydrogenase family)